MMAERYTLYEIGKLRERFALPLGVPPGVRPSYNISPTQIGAVIINRDGENVLERMKWGFVPANAKDTNSVFRYKTYVAKAEGVLTKPTWQDAVRHNRCLVPANGYYEWQKTPDGLLPYYVQPVGQDLFSFAGIYSSWTDPDGKQWGTYAILTTLHDRGPKMPLQRPVILDPADEAAWLSGDDMDMSSLFTLVHPLPESDLRIHRVSPDVKNKKASGAHLIQPAS